MLHVSKFHGSWQPRHSCAAILPSSRSAYFWSINLDLKFNWNFHVEICHKGSTFKLHRVYQARFGPPPPQSGAERRYKAYNKPISAWINLKISRFVVRPMHCNGQNIQHCFELYPHATSPLFSPYITCWKNYWSTGRGDIAPCPPPKYATDTTRSRQLAKNR